MGAWGDTMYGLYDNKRRTDETDGTTHLGKDVVGSGS
jgi:hypothetical protein